MGVGPVVGEIKISEDFSCLITEVGTPRFGRNSRDE